MYILKGNPNYLFGIKEIQWHHAWELVKPGPKIIRHAKAWGPQQAIAKTPTPWPHQDKEPNAKACGLSSLTCGHMPWSTKSDPGQWSDGNHSFS